MSNYYSSISYYSVVIFISDISYYSDVSSTFSYHVEIYHKDYRLEKVVENI